MKILKVKIRVLTTSAGMTIEASGARQEMIIVSSMTEMHPVKSKG